MPDTSFNKIIDLIEKRKNNAYKKVNEELILLYLDVGKYLFELQQNSKYGDKITTKAAEFMKNNYQSITYKDDEFATPLVTQLSWTNNLLIISGSKSQEERHFYLRLAVKNNYSKRELDRQISSSYYERYILSGSIQLPTCKKTIDEDDYPDTRTLDIYSLEFLDLPHDFSENDLKKSIINNLKNFILEVGKDFTFIGDEYRIQVGKHDFYIDLLFYNWELSCLVAFELKLGEFKAEYLGKMNLYLKALDRDVRKENENPSVGVILCSSKDKDIVEYSLDSNMTQTMVAAVSVMFPPDM